jgi:plastocyanin
MRALLFAVALLAACGAASAETHVVTIEGMKFQPATLSVKPGDTVTWRNKDVVPHTATAAGKFDSGNIAAGQSWSWKAAAKGEFGYVCTYHPGMKATLTVK